MAPKPEGGETWPIHVIDREGRPIYLTRERWEHALDHPGMHPGLLRVVLGTVRAGRRKRDAQLSDTFRYIRRVPGLPGDYTHVVVVVKFGYTLTEPLEPNNFVLTAYLVERG